MVTPIGVTALHTFAAARLGTSGIKSFPANISPIEHCAPIAGRVPELAPEYQNPDIDRYSELANAAAFEAIHKAQLTDDGTPVSVAVVIGTGFGGLDGVEKAMRILIEKGPRRVPPRTVPNVIPSSAATSISTRYGFDGPILAPATACSAGAHALIEAALLIRHGLAEIVVAGGAEAPVTNLSISSFASARALSRWPGAPEDASRPFCVDRSGFVIAEGAGVMVLESEWSLRQRNVVPIAELCGFAMNSDAYHLTRPLPSGRQAMRCMKTACFDAGAPLDQISVIMAHATGTISGDASEAEAIFSLYDKKQEQVPPIVATKSMTGHMLGASGAVQAGIACMALQQGMLPRTHNLTLKNCDPQWLPVGGGRMLGKYVLSNSFGFGGINACLVFAAA